MCIGLTGGKSTSLSQFYCMEFVFCSCFDLSNQFNLYEVRGGLSMAIFTSVFSISQKNEPTKKKAHRNYVQPIDLEFNGRLGSISNDNTITFTPVIFRYARIHNLCVLETYQTIQHDDLAICYTRINIMWGLTTKVWKR